MKAPRPAVRIRKPPRREAREPARGVRGRRAGRPLAGASFGDGFPEPSPLASPASLANPPKEAVPASLPPRAGFSRIAPRRAGHPAEAAGRSLLFSRIAINIATSTRQRALLARNCLFMPTVTEQVGRRIMSSSDLAEHTSVRTGLVDRHRPVPALQHAKGQSPDPPGESSRHRPGVALQNGLFVARGRRRANGRLTRFALLPLGRRPQGFPSGSFSRGPVGAFVLPPAGSSFFPSRTFHYRPVDPGRLIQFLICP